MMAGGTPILGNLQMFIIYVLHTPRLCTLACPFGTIRKVHEVGGMGAGHQHIPTLVAVFKEMVRCQWIPELS